MLCINSFNLNWYAFWTLLLLGCLWWGCFTHVHSNIFCLALHLSSDNSFLWATSNWLFLWRQGLFLLICWHWEARNAYILSLRWHNWLAITLLNRSHFTGANRSYRIGRLLSTVTEVLLHLLLICALCLLQGLVVGLMEGARYSRSVVSHWRMRVLILDPMRCLKYNAVFLWVKFLVLD